MRLINKQPSPALLEKYKELLKKKAAPNFEDLKKEAGYLLNYALAEEQGFICCYCMSSIKERKDKEGKIILKDGLPMLAMKIEHFRSQKNNPALVTDYNNLFCACEGGCKPGEKKGKENTYCDSHKSEEDFTHLQNLASVKKKDFERSFQFRYNYQGRISSKNSDIHKELESILNLNFQPLRKMREAAWDCISNKMRKFCKNDSWDGGEDYAKTLVKKYRKKQKNGRYYAYCEMIIFLLKKRFKNI